MDKASNFEEEILESISLSLDELVKRTSKNENVLQDILKRLDAVESKKSDVRKPHFVDARLSEKDRAVINELKVKLDDIKYSIYQAENSIEFRAHRLQLIRESLIYIDRNVLNGPTVALVSFILIIIMSTIIYMQSRNTARLEEGNNKIYGIAKKYEKEKYLLEAKQYHKMDLQVADSLYKLNPALFRKKIDSLKIASQE
jgi:membrane protein insertase Oxa1/YidC/SpoIIIJ